MRFSAGSLILVLFFCSCVKTEAPQPLYIINEVSGRVKQITSGMPGSPIATIQTYTYDSVKRVTTYKRITNDSSLNPMITASDYFTFAYGAANDAKPVSSTHTNQNGTVNEITNYTYDTYNRVIKEDLYRSGILTKSNAYNYLTNAFTRVVSYGTPFIPRSKDTVTIDGSRNIVAMKTYSIVNPNNPPKTVTLTYDTKKNPIGETNIGIFVKTFFVDDNLEFNLSTNNILSQSGDITGVPYSTTVFYDYSTNGFPIKATLANNLTSVFVYFP